MTPIKIILAFIALATMRVNSCDLGVYKCNQLNIIDTYDQVKKFKVYLGELEELKVNVNSSLMLLEIQDINNNIILKKIYNTTKLNQSIYSSEANVQTLNPYSFYTITMVMPESKPLLVKLVCD